MTYWLPVVMSLAFWLYYERIMAAEEAFLRGKYGAQFESWANSTPAFLPRMRGWVPPAHPLNMTRVLRGESSDILALFLIFATYDAFADTRARGEFHVDWWWVALLLASVVLYFATRVQRKRARREAEKNEGNE
jgi:protein-S-isoprenylcysteine O-methyltransferase Ste14